MKNLLFVTETKGYLILSLKEKLQGSYNVITVSAKVDEISKIKEPLSAILIYGDEDLLAKRDSLTYLKDRAAEDDIAVFAPGTCTHAAGTRRDRGRVYVAFER